MNKTLIATAIALAFGSATPAFANPTNTNSADTAQSNTQNANASSAADAKGTSANENSTAVGVNDNTVTDNGNNSSTTDNNSNQNNDSSIDNTDMNAPADNLKTLIDQHIKSLYKENLSLDCFYSELDIEDGVLVIFEKAIPRMSLCINCSDYLSFSGISNLIALSFPFSIFYIFKIVSFIFVYVKTNILPSRTNKLLILIVRYSPKKGINNVVRITDKATL